jgi:hypothetical protein
MAEGTQPVWKDVALRKLNKRRAALQRALEHVMRAASS